MENKKRLDIKLNKLNKYFDIKLDLKSKSAIVTFFVYEEITKNLKETLKLFINSNLKFNNDVTIYVFTNHLTLQEDFQSEKVVFLYFPQDDNEVMTNRVIFNYYAIKLFSSYEQLFLFDTDLIPLKSYSNSFNLNFDIGLTISNDWFKYNKFPINAGFLICNNYNKDQINNFKEFYLSSYQKALDLEKQILKLKLISHDNRHFEKWWGDQYLFFIMFNFKFPNGVKKYFDTEIKNINFRFFNELSYNHQSADLKTTKIDFKMDEFISKLTDVFFIHLKGGKKFANQLSDILIKN
ncbi:hypothetical protein OAI01_01305 [Alphaproteobacteria bacterium]|nr:hypothetical protein [Alphaproteobacteria bacterium]